ncbi:RNA ligase and tail fiber protein attachment catalyst [Pseudomonas phage vB_PpuM-NoPa]|uniref:RNA ligase and tail fiber protein attachment catalyst n=1 Tax=Pseudomonas phage vB_PpuM-NoPa TaxID=3132619 RepID=A0AAX4MZC4_9CAUD
MKLHLDMYQELIKAGLVKAKVDTETNRVIIKYARKVFYDKLWLKHPLLVEARGHVFDAVTGNLLVAPPTKIFNLGEYGTGENIPKDQLVSVVRKVNGFLACVTFIDGEMVVTTTGSLDSDFVHLARKHLEKLNWEAIGRPEGQTFHFEICDNDDPHIVTEIPGAYLIGQRSHNDLSSALEFHLNDTAYQIGAFRPGSFEAAWAAVLVMLDDVSHEGFMVRDFTTGETLVKLKSPHYLTKKFLMRMGNHKAREMFADPIKFKMNLDEEFYDVFDHIVKEFSCDAWMNFNDQDRRAVMEDFL